MTAQIDASVRTIESRIPMIQTGQALLSLRDSGHSLPTAVAEPVDNSVEAGAHNIWVRLDDKKEGRSKAHVHRIVISDDGRGMDLNTLHHYLVLGFSSRYMQKDTIGKYGVGAKLAALNFGRRMDVWSRTTENDNWMHVCFDLDEALAAEKTGGNVGVDAPKPKAVPDDVLGTLSIGSGTIVVWSKVDRLEDGRLAPNCNDLRLELEKELSRMFRSFINGGIKLYVNGKSLLAHDPLMLMDNTWADHVLTKHQTMPAEKGVQHYAATEIGREKIVISGSSATLIVTLYPKEVVRKRGVGGDALAKELRLAENMGSLSFVRRGREVSYTSVPKMMPGGINDPDRFIGIEVSFNPDLDDYFGVRNVKRGVEPHGELRKLIRDALKKHVPTARKLIDEQWGAKSREEQDSIGEHAAVVEAVKEINLQMPQSRAESDASPEALAGTLAELAADVGLKKEEQPAFIEKRKDLPFIVESVDFPGSMFLTTQHIGGKVIIRLNTRHKFYRDVWEPIKAIADRDPSTITGIEAAKTASRTISALQLLLIAYGKAESMHHNPVDQYEDLLNHWGQFLSTMLGKIKDIR